MNKFFQHLRWRNSFSSVTLEFSLHPGSHTLVLRAPPFTVACIVSLPHRSDDCPTDEAAHTLTLAPHVADLPQEDLRQLFNYGRFPQTFVDEHWPIGTLYRSSDKPEDLAKVAPATSTITALLFGGMADISPNVSYDTLPGYDQEEANHASDSSHAFCPAYPLCDATSILPRIGAPPYFLVSVPLITSWQLTVPFAATDANLQRVDVPIHYRATDALHWVGDQSVLAPLVASTLCDYERSLFVSHVSSTLAPYFTLVPAHVCQAQFVDAGAATGGRLAISQRVFFMDPIAHRAFPAFPTFSQQGQ